MKGFAYLAGVTTLRLDRERCIGCGMCPQVCPHQVFVLKERKSNVVAPDACMECGACALNCPVEALSVDAGVGCASGILAEWLRERRGRRGGGAGCCG
jgi:ferredoxin